MAIEVSDHLGLQDRALLTRRDLEFAEIGFESTFAYYWRPCAVRVLLLVDNLDYSRSNGFGLSTFIEALLQPSFYVNFRITLATIDNIDVGSLAMLPDETRIAGRIKQFRFDNIAHFKPDMYDVVFLFGFESSYGARGPDGSLALAELQVLTQFQNDGGGLFATGDHAALGKAMCHKVARARNMRLWETTLNGVGEDMVSMSGRYRNDTNRIGNDPGSQFDDQSDDIPQPISPVFYTRQSGIFRYSFPHPLLCGPNGVIRVMPDHPHEGECRKPANTSLTLNYTGNLGPEYPNAVDGGPRPLPEIISYNGVLGGTTSGGKDPTAAQSFPGIAAYDGHRAGVGRVVTDATWHHFVNINLTGIPSKPQGDPKRRGFLNSAAGQVALTNIRAYYRNIATWLSPPARIRCMNARFLWSLVWNERVLEAVLTARHIGLERIPPKTLSLIGQHARDALGRYASRCQSRRIILDIIDFQPSLVPEIDPWRPRIGDDKDFDDEEVPVLDFNPVLDAALGGALVAISTEFEHVAPERLEKLDGEQVMDVARKGAQFAMERAQTSLRSVLEKADKRLVGSDRGASTSA